MPTIPRLMIKAAMLYLLIGITFAVVPIVDAAYPLHPLLGAFQPTALHMFVVGWLTQLIFGVALWMFPPWSKAAPRGPEWIGWLCFALLNAGLIARLVAEPFTAVAPALWNRWLLVLSALLQVLAIWLFVGLVWRRVRGKPGGRS